MNWNKSLPEQTAASEVVLLNSVLLLSGLVALIGNSLILVVISKYEAFRKEYPCIYVIALLAAADASNGFGSVVASTELFRIWAFSLLPIRWECLLASIPLMTGGIASQLALVCVVMDRYYAIKDPMAYQARQHRLKSALKQGAGIVLVMVFLGAVAFVGVDPFGVPTECTGAGSAGKLFKILWAALTFGSALFIIIMYIILLAMVRKKLTANKFNQSVQAENLRIQAKVTRIASIILAVYITCWAIPVFIVNLLLFVSPQAAVMAGRCVAVGAQVSSAANIFVYIGRLANFTVYLQKLFSCLPCSSNNNAVIPLQ